ncbi:MAG: hypothetical protein Q4A49_05815 [Neisseria sp.]|nr:hypothetical protein [Neisseria sp.]
MKIGIRLFFAVCLFVVFILFPLEQSEAQSADMLASELSCSGLYVLEWHEMDERQKHYSLKCDAAAADEQWYAVYGDMGEEENLSAVVWE